MLVYVSIRSYVTLHYHSRLFDMHIYIYIYIYVYTYVSSYIYIYIYIYIHTYRAGARHAGGSRRPANEGGPPLRSLTALPLLGGSRVQRSNSDNSNINSNSDSNDNDSNNNSNSNSNDDSNDHHNHNHDSNRELLCYMPPA